MGIVGGLDVHRRQITFDYLDTVTGEVCTGRVEPANRMTLREWLARFDGVGGVALAVEACTGWRYVVEELEAAGVEAHLAEPADTAAARGNKRRAKTDRADARHLRELLAGERLPESWIGPTHVLEVRARGRLYVDLMNERRAWCQRLHAQLFHQGAPAQRSVLTDEGRMALAAADLSPAGRQAVETAVVLIDGLTAQIEPLRAQLGRFARNQIGCRALMSLYGIGPLTAPIVWAELGDTRRFSSSRRAVRHTGIDITVYSSDGKRTRGHPARQGPPTLRWALFEAAHSAAKATSPDHDYYREVKARLGTNRACLSVARKLARRAHHLLRELGEDAWSAPTTVTPARADTPTAPPAPDEACPAA
jgi:transposase